MAFIGTIQTLIAELFNTEYRGRWTQVQSLVRELRSYMPCSAAQKKKKKRRKKKVMISVFSGKRSQSGLKQEELFAQSISY